jgi:pimeloyl-ACP methyl ester carboxylesterase
MLFLDQRGMGLSTLVTARTLALQGETKEQVDYLKLFRADTAVKDWEAIRECLTADYPEEKKKWSLVGQSYGGFVATTYLSQAPEGLREVFTLGGLPPVSQKDPDEVYRRLHGRVLERNRKYYEKYPEDVEAVKRIARLLQNDESPLLLPDGGTLSLGRFLSMGISFGFHGGLDDVHDVVLRMINDLDVFGFLTKPTLVRIQATGVFDDHVLYAIMHESIYCQRAGKSDWSADRLFLKDQASEGPHRAEDAPPNFTGEMIFRHHFTAYPELRSLREVADSLAAVDDWPDLYDVDRLKENKVPVYSATYVDDMYVDFDFAQETAKTIKRAKTFITNMMYHDALRSKTEEVFRNLFALRDDSID